MYIIMIKKPSHTTVLLYNSIFFINKLHVSTRKTNIRLSIKLIQKWGVIPVVPVANVATKVFIFLL
jgi:hypothetical protein